MLRAFNIIRVATLFVAILFSIIVLGVAVHLQSILEPSDLTRFVPIAIFVSVSTIVGCVIILWFGSRERFWAITQTRWELRLLSLLGALWFGLALFLSVSEVPDIECPDEPDGNPSPYTDEIFHAQYHVLQAFSILNALMLLGYCLWLLVLAFRHSYAGRKQVWNARVNEAQWFTPTKLSSDEKFTRLPPPVSSSTRRRSYWRNGLTPDTVTPEPSATVSRNASNSSASPPVHPHSRSALVAAVVAATVPSKKTSKPATKAMPPTPPTPSTPPTPPTPTTKYLSARRTTRPVVEVPPPPPVKAKTYVMYAPQPPKPALAAAPAPSRRAGTLDRRPSAKNQEQPQRPNASRSNTYAYTTTTRQPAPPIRSFSNTNPQDPPPRRDRSLR